MLEKDVGQREVAGSLEWVRTMTLDVTEAKGETARAGLSGGPAAGGVGLEQGLTQHYRVSEGRPGTSSERATIVAAPHTPSSDDFARLCCVDAAQQSRPK